MAIHLTLDSLLPKSCCHPETNWKCLFIICMCIDSCTKFKITHLITSAVDIVLTYYTVRADLRTKQILCCGCFNQAHRPFNSYIFDISLTHMNKGFSHPPKETCSRT